MPLRQHRDLQDRARQLGARSQRSNTAGSLLSLFRVYELQGAWNARAHHTACGVRRRGAFVCHLHSAIPHTQVVLVTRVCMLLQEAFGAKAGER